MNAGLVVTFQVFDLDQVVSEGPSMPMKCNDGSMIHEALTLVGHVEAPDDKREQLECYAICLELAHYDRREKRWDCCLFSEESANTLAELGADGQFPYACEAVPSSGHLATLEARADGQPVPALALREWATPAPLDALARADQRGRIQSPWLRRVVRNVAGGCAEKQ